MQETLKIKSKRNINIHHKNVQKLRACRIVCVLKFNLGIDKRDDLSFCTRGKG